MKRALLFAVVSLSAAAIAAPALAGPGGTARPFKGNAAGQTTVTGGPLVFASSSAGTMISTHLGKGSYSITATQDWTTAVFFTHPCAVVAGTFTLTAANGATVTGTVSGETCELAPFVNTSYASSLTATINGGTGRFAGASGTLTVNGLSTGPVGGPFNDTSTWTGTISY